MELLRACRSSTWVRGITSNFPCESASVIEINARDRLGLLYDICEAMEKADIQIISSHIATYGQRAVDVFYVKDAYGHKILHKAKQEKLQQMLREEKD